MDGFIIKQIGEIVKGEVGISVTSRKKGDVECRFFKMGINDKFPLAKQGKVVYNRLCS